MLFFARFPDKGVYCAGPQKNASGETVPGGPIGYESQAEAQVMADAIRGDVIRRSDDEALDFCKRTGAVLWIKKASGGYGYVKETVSDHAPDLIRVEEPERQAAIRASATINPAK